MSFAPRTQPIPKSRVFAFYGRSLDGATGRPDIARGFTLRLCQQANANLIATHIRLLPTLFRNPRPWLAIPSVRDISRATTPGGAGSFLEDDVSISWSFSVVELCKPFVDPMPSIVPPPNPAREQLASNGSAGNDHLPEMPNLCPCRF
jgi:hypothetical protein